MLLKLGNFGGGTSTISLKVTTNINIIYSSLKDIFMLLNLLNCFVIAVTSTCFRQLGCASSFTFQPRKIDNSYFWARVEGNRILSIQSAATYSGYGVERREALYTVLGRLFWIRVI